MSTIPFKFSAAATDYIYRGNVTTVLVTAPPGRHDDRGRHWQKMKKYTKPLALKKALTANREFSNFTIQRDIDGDIIAFTFLSPNVAKARNAVRRILGTDHSLLVFEGGSEGASRKAYLLEKRAQTRRPS